MPPDRKLSYEEFLAWCDEDTWAEWVNGEIVVVSPASDRHQDLASFLIAVLRIFVEALNLGVLRPAPFQMKTGPGLPGREPDILFVAREHLDRLKANYLEGPADLVIEILSPESRLRDRGEKRAEYEAGGVREYWLIDPERREADFYVLDARGRYRLVEIGQEEIYESPTLAGFRLNLAWLWRDPLPKVLDVARELGLLA
jgi:Uma2 family endonuclease